MRVMNRVSDLTTAGAYIKTGPREGPGSVAGLGNRQSLPEGNMQRRRFILGGCGGRRGMT